jgi:hypothetical protein
LSEVPAGIAACALNRMVVLLKFHDELVRLLLKRMRATSIQLVPFQ